ncbi:MAG: hypothetical protein KC713_09210, partial [Candidatus Omnitrophica bacterium]|nr:hypothetical protein [Candidatus Omnitrophota bacterium]
MQLLTPVKQHVTTLYAFPAPMARQHPAKEIDPELIPESIQDNPVATIMISHVDPHGKFKV